MAFFETERGGVPLVCSSVIPVRHGFTTRRGGVSRGIFASLDLAENRGDDPEAVRENYRRLAAALDFDPGRLVFTRQVHGTAVHTVTGADSRGLFTPGGAARDGIVTAEAGLPLICFTADCVPLLMCDPGRHIAAAVHCGWRSSVGDIAGAAVGAMQALGARPEDIRAAVGPAIGACCFEVGGEVTEAVRAWLGPAGEQFIRPMAGCAGKYLVDLRGCCRARLLSLGLRGENIDVSDECTMCSPEKYWSHRYTRGERGTQAAVIIP